MKLLSTTAIVYLLSAAVAAVATETQVQNLDADDPKRGSLFDPPTGVNNLDSGNLPVPEAGPRSREPLITKCVRGCLNGFYGAAGCGSTTDWDCLCHKNNLALEISNCYRRKCESKGFLDQSSFKGIEKVKCEGYNPQAADPFRWEPTKNDGY
ncbi:hypothetical protein QBC38DRAFT_472870 [Podospora fimiseda]|uniref:CFEM domain-containing protein n=1 Tax=Podospora fimiseda TaxID=252190 RepID=A0AAN7H1J0_9PEZI|nr:hypothetical protein QBC38DRAFT_472870 [Podospora fimiseda]